MKQGSVSCSVTEWLVVDNVLTVNKLKYFQHTFRYKFCLNYVCFAKHTIPLVFLL
jgi:hypothetical protein